MHYRKTIVPNKLPRSLNKLILEFCSTIQTLEFTFVMKTRTVLIPTIFLYLAKCTSIACCLAEYMNIGKVWTIT